MFEQLTALRGWRFDVAMVGLIIVSVYVTHSLFRLGDWLTQTWRSHGTADASRIER